MTRSVRSTTTAPKARRTVAAIAEIAARAPTEGALDLLLGWKASETPRAPFGFSQRSDAPVPESAAG